MKIIAIYFFLLSFWVNNAIGFSLTGFKGLSLSNLTFYLLFIVWAFAIVFKRKLLEWNDLNKYIIILIFFVILSTPYRILLDEIHIGLKQNIVGIKKWIEPFIIFFIMFNILDDKKTCKKVLLGLGFFYS